MLFKLVKEGLISVKDAAPKANLPEVDFIAQMDSYLASAR